jgi:uncharacterized protein YbaR (Trm112 family)
MRIWLLDILACPICKHYPLDLTLLKWETEDKLFSKVESAFKNRQLPVLEENCILTLPNGKKDKCIKILEEGQLQIEDEFSREKKPFVDYLRTINEKTKSVQTIEDATGSVATRVLDQVKTKAVDRLKKTLKQFESAGSRRSIGEEKKSLQELMPEMSLLNWYFFLTEVDEALIGCKKCHRWYPVIETIPHMLPDDLRNDDEDVAFLKKWSSKLSQTVLNEGKPFNLKTPVGEEKEKKSPKVHQL